MLGDVERDRARVGLYHRDGPPRMRAAISDKIRFETAFFAKLVDPPGIMVREIETGGRFAGVACPVGSDHGQLMLIAELVHIHDGVLVGPFVFLTASVPVNQFRLYGNTPWRERVGKSAAI